MHYCSQRRGEPAIPLAEYTRSHIHAAHVEEKACAPYCTIACVHQASSLDGWRSPQTPNAIAVTAPEPLVQITRRAAVSR